jgi:hypothetical protein
MEGYAYIGHKVADGSNESNSALTKTDMQPVVAKGGTNIATHWREKHQGHHDIREIVVIFKIRNDGLRKVSILRG